ncbi:hypothetical protein ACFFLM_03155 [Deinococcus oregonensis]|uniref:Uncharacterized protein n=1 Tax=Deinococcus oregonensis TaxID=1805970 RepID=A0ABV6AXP2_9DEIO
MSFLGQAGNLPGQECLRRHTPHSAHIDPVPGDALEFPMVNIGPWGRDHHQRLERIHAPYSFQTVPEMLWRVVQNIWQAD